MRRGSRNLVPTILAAEAAIIGLLFLGHFTIPDRAAPSAELTEALPASADPAQPRVEVVLPAPAARNQVERAAAAGPAQPLPAAVPDRPVDAPEVVEASTAGPETAGPPDTADSPRAVTDLMLDLQASVQSEFWAAQALVVQPLPWPDPAAPRVAVGKAVPVAEPAAQPEEVAVSDRTAAPELVDGDAADEAVVPPPVPSRRPAPPPARIIADSAEAPAPIPVAAEPARLAPPRTVTIDGRVFACSVLPARLQARFASCGGGAESTVGTVEINGTTVTCDRLSAPLRSRFPSCGG